jgi:hypothetical protein
MIAAQLSVTISQEVTDHIARLQIDTAFHDILDHLPSLYPDASKIECELDPGIEDESDPVVVFLVTVPDQGPSFPTPFMTWSNWASTRYSGRVLYHFTVLFAHES